MLRGAIIVFTALLSVAFLRRSIQRKAWFGIFLVVVGLALVGISDIVFSQDSTHGPNAILTGKFNQIFCFKIMFFTTDKPAEFAMFLFLNFKHTGITLNHEMLSISVYVGNYVIVLRKHGTVNLMLIDV